MPAISFIMHEEFVTDALTVVFLHSLWQFALIAPVVLRVLKKNRINHSSLRYALALLSLACMVICAMLTFFWYYSPAEETGTAYTAVQLSATVNSLRLPDINMPVFWLEKYKNWILTFWITGALIPGLKWLSSLIYVQWLKKSASCPGIENPVFRQWTLVKEKWGFRKKIRLGFSRQVQSPVFIGQLKSVILFPVSLVNRLSPEEVEFILLHELAHYARCDWWANMLQSILEVIFYYHPAVYYLSRLIREEREKCRDEFAISIMGGHQIAYAKTLIKLQEWKNSPTPAMAMAFTGNNRIFVDRIKIILNMNQKKNVRSENWINGMIIVLSLFFTGKETIANHFPAFGPGHYAERFFSIVPFSNSDAVKDSIPAQKESITIIRKNADKEVKMQMENGEIKKLEIDGKEISPEDYDKYQEITKEITIRTYRDKPEGNQKMFFFDMDEEGLKWQGDIDIRWDTILRDFSLEGMKGMPFDMNKFQDEIMKLQDEMKNSELKFFFDMDTMSLGNVPERIMRFHFRDGKELNPDGKVFEFTLPEGDHFSEDFPFGENLPGKENNVNEVLGNQLNNDGLLIPDKENIIELSGKNLKINGEKQPANIWHKYKRIFEDETGTRLEKKSKISFRFRGKDSKRKYRAL